MALNKKFFPKVSAGAGGGDAANTFASENFNTVLYTGTGSAQRIGGYINRGAVFNGSSSTITIPHNSVFDFETATTMSIWVNRNTTNRAFIIDKANGGSGSYGWQFEFFGTTKGYQLQMHNTSNGAISSLETGANSTTGNWEHIVVTHNGSNEFKIYFNSVLKATETLSGTVSTNTGDVKIGTYQLSSGFEFDGKLDQLRFFNKLLSQSEIDTLYAETFASTTISTTDIFSDSSGVALYQLDGNANDTGLVSAGTIVSSNKIIDLNVDSYTSGTTIDDSTSNNNDATIVGDVSYDNWLGRGRFDLQGSSDYLKIDASTTFNGATDLTLEGWFRPDNLTAVDHFFTIYNTSGSSNKLYLRLNDTDGDLDMHAYGSGSASIASLVTSNSNARVQANKWNHIVGVWESGTAMSVYVNGVLAGTTASMGNLNTAGTEDLYIGVLKGYIGSYDFDGEVGEIRGYSSALTASEVLQNFNATRHYYAAYDGTASNITYQEATKFSPDLVWIKKRSSSTSSDHVLNDSVRGANKILYSNLTNGEDTAGGAGSAYFNSFDSNGFTVGSSTYYNGSGETYVAWCFNAGSGSSASNTDGTITSTVKANTDAGFSIVKWSSTSSSSDTIGHGLNSKPEVVLYKKTSSTGSWFWYTDVIDGSWDELVLNSSAAKTDFAGTYATSDTFKSVTSSSGADWISYCFHSVTGYQKIGSYTGNGSANGTIVETGFEPAFVMIKNTTTAYRWYILDNKRDTTNPNSARLFANDNTAEATNSDILNFSSNGFELITSDAEVNKSGDTMIYLAIAADPDTTTPTVENSFDVVTYTGNGGTQDIETDFKPDLVWIKSRTDAYDHNLYDLVRGADGGSGVTDKVLMSNKTAAQGQGNGDVTITEDGFTVVETSTGESGFEVNKNNSNFVAWCWKAGDHDDNLPQINTEGSSGGSTLESIVSVNDEAGFSIVKYTATGTAGATIGHGLSSAPELIIVKHLDGTSNYPVYVTGLSAASKYLYLNTSDGETSSSNPDEFHSTAPTSTVFSVGLSGNTNTSGGNYIAYCWYSVAGHSKIGSYVGTGGSISAIDVGFEPRFVMIKSTGNTSGSWAILDNLREGTSKHQLSANGSHAEYDNQGVTFTSTGFSPRQSLSSDTNTSGVTFVYMAFK